MDSSTGNLGKTILTEEKGKRKGTTGDEGKMEQKILESKETENV
jgi:hypothetical protein